MDALYKQVNDEVKEEQLEVKKAEDIVLVCTHLQRFFQVPFKCGPDKYGSVSTEVGDHLGQEAVLENEGGTG